jgi:hypothetical protein
VNNFNVVRTGLMARLRPGGPEVKETTASKTFAAEALRSLPNELGPDHNNVDMKRKADE